MESKVTQEQEFNADDYQVLEDTVETNRSAPTTVAHTVDKVLAAHLYVAPQQFETFPHAVLDGLCSYQRGYPL